MVRDEAVFLPIWLRYYSHFFAPEDIYVLDDGSSDGSTHGGGFTRIPVASSVIDWSWHHHTLQSWQHSLLRRYDVVLCCDVDEIVVPHPSTGTLSDYVDRIQAEFVTCAGYEVIHLKGQEPAFDPGQPVLGQRRHWFGSPAYSKPLLARVPMEWVGGFHGRIDGLVNPDPQLLLIHLHRMDYDICLARHRQRTARTWNQRDIQEGWAYQNRVTEEEHFLGWFYEDTCCGVPLVIEPIPDEWLGAV